MGLTFSTNIKLYQMKNKNMSTYLCVSTLLGIFQGLMLTAPTTFGDLVVGVGFSVVMWLLMLMPMLNAE
jgi:hypothetical protein